MFIRKLTLVSAALLTLSGAALAGNSSSIVQNGNGNGASTHQRGRDNDSQVVQYGNGNGLSIRQVGRNNNAGGGQNGDGNWAEVHQRQTRH
jgi:minor curlin subunit